MFATLAFSTSSTAYFSSDNAVPPRLQGLCQFSHGFALIRIELQWKFWFCTSCGETDTSSASLVPTSKLTMLSITVYLCFYLLAWFLSKETFLFLFKEVIFELMFLRFVIWKTHKTHVKNVQNYPILYELLILRRKVGRALLEWRPSDTKHNAWVSEGGAEGA